MITYKYHTSSKTILADLYTPVGVYMRLRDLYPELHQKLFLKSYNP